MFEELIDYAQQNHVPIVRKQTRSLLALLCKQNKPENILEIGTAIGFSGLVMLEASKNSTLTTIEKSEEMAKIAKQNFEKAGQNVNLICQDAIEVLPRLEQEGKRFDFIFLDGPKAQYIHYLPYLKRLLKVGGVLFADDIYFYGLVKGDELPSKKRSIVKNLRLFIADLKNDGNFESQFLDIEDGISISKRIK